MRGIAFGRSILAQRLCFSLVLAWLLGVVIQAGAQSPPNAPSNMPGAAASQYPSLAAPSETSPPSPTGQYPATASQQPGSTTSPSPGAHGNALLLLNGNTLPLKAAAGEPPPPPPLPNLPPPVGMGGFPPAPNPSDQPSSLEQFIHDNLTVTLRDGGTLRFYGFLRGDLDYATNRFNDIQNPFFVLPNNGAFRTGSNNVAIVGNNPNYSLYPRLTRFGAEYYGKPIDCLDGAVASGRLEVDWLTINPILATVPNSESRELLRLRLAYVQLQHNGFTFVMGQDWDLISPLLPTINDNTLMWNAGNLGDRRPIMKFLYDWKVADGAIIQIQNGAYLASAIVNGDLDGNGILDAEDHVLPGWQGRVGVILDSWVPNEKIIGGVWGAVAQDRMQTPLGALRRTRFNTDVIGLDLRLPLMCGLTFQGECYTGRNLDDLRGGSSQGVNPSQGSEVRASGGWCELVARPCQWYQIALGTTTDNPVNGDVTGLTIAPNANAGRTNQFTWYCSNRFILGRGLTVGADYLNWTTDWQTYGRAHSQLFKFFVQQNF